MANIQRIVEKAHSNKIELRPHFKTHQSHEVGRWFRDKGISRCTVSSLKMAEYFAEDKWEDITIAFPVNIHEVDSINKLARSVKLNLLISNIGVLPNLIEKLLHPVRCFIDVDTGYHRTGFRADDHTALMQALDELNSSPMVSFAGFLSHAGHTYKCRSIDEIKAVSEKEVEIMFGLGEKYRPQYPELKLSIGDTPSASVIQNFQGIDEMRPGNLVFYDLTQQQIGSCTPQQIALAMACPVVATYPNRNEIIIYGGGVHFSKDYYTDEHGRHSFGQVVKLTSHGWELPVTSMYVKSLSQEHGIIHAPDGYAEMIKPGDILGILPVHACLTADAMGAYCTLGGELISRLN